MPNFCGVLRRQDKNINLLNEFREEFILPAMDYFANGKIALACEALECPANRAEGKRTGYLASCLFNFVDLQKKYGGDTPSELLENLLSEMSLPGALNLFNGSFTGYHYDSVNDELFLFRDQLGSEFLFYGFNRTGDCYFSNRLDYLLQIKGLDTSVDLHALGDYFSVGYIAAPRTIYRGIKKLEAAHFIKIINGGVVLNHRFWNVNFLPKIEISYRQAVDESRQLINQAIGRRLDHCRNASFLLSGGIDSGIVLGLARQQDLRCNRSLSISFAEAAYNESNLAAKVAAIHEVAHSIRLVESVDVKRMDNFLKIAGEPFADSSLLPSAIAVEASAKYAPAFFTGDGADEVFGGYRRYRAMAIRHSGSGMIGMSMRAIAKCCCGILPPVREIRSRYGNFYRALNSISRPPLAAYASFQEIYSPELKAEILKFQAEDDYIADWKMLRTEINGSDEVESYNGLDVMYYLPEDGCRKMNISSKAAGVTEFAPFMDMDVVNYALRLPREYRFNLFENKRILRSIGSDLLPDEIFKMPKRGFGVPVAAWFQDELSETLRDMAETMDEWDEEGWLDKKAVSNMIDDHVFYHINHGAQLWTLYCLWRWKVNR